MSATKKYVVNTPLKGLDPRGKVTPQFAHVDLDPAEKETKELVAGHAITLIPEPAEEADAEGEAKPASKAKK